MELYREEDLKATKAAVTKRCVAAGVYLAAVMTLCALFMSVWRNQIALLAVFAAGMVIFYYIMVVKVVPWIRYMLYQRDIKRGRSHDITCRFLSLSEGERISDGVAFHEFVVSLAETDSDDEDERAAQERLLFWDADKPAPDIKPGQWLRVTAFGNYITAYETI